MTSEPVIERPRILVNVYAGSGLTFNADGTEITWAVGANGYFDYAMVDRDIIAGGPFQARFRVLSGSAAAVRIQQYNGGTYLTGNDISALPDSDTWVIDTPALHASATRLRLVPGPVSGTPLTITQPVFTTTAGVTAIIPIGEPSLAQIDRFINALADGAPNKFRDTFAVSRDQGTGALPTKRADGSVICEPATLVRLDSALSDVDQTMPIAVQLLLSGPSKRVSLRFRFAGGSPADVVHELYPYGDGVWGRVLAANTLAATPTGVRILVDNLTSATLPFTAVQFIARGMTLKNAATLSGDVLDTWPVRKVVNRLNDAEAVATRRRRRMWADATAGYSALAAADPTSQAISQGVRAWLLETAHCVLSPTGNDANPGTWASPKLTAVAAMAATTAGQVIAVQAGMDFDPHSAGSPSNAPKNRHFVSYGFGERAARMDVRQKAPTAGGTWVNVSGKVWKWSATHREPMGAGRSTTIGATASNLYNFMLWLDDAKLNWLTGTDGIAARTAALQASTETSWFVHKTGSTNTEPRTEAGNDAATGFDYYIALKDASDPNGRDLRIADRHSTGAFAAGCQLWGLDLIGGARKDNLAFEEPLSAPWTICTFHNCRVLDAPEHAFVGPLHTRGSYYASGRAAPGVSNSVDQNRSLGYAMNFHAGATVIPIALHHDLIELVNFQTGIGGHGQGTPVGGGYTSLSIKCLVASNVGNVSAFTAVGSPQVNAYITDGVTIEWVYATDCTILAYVDGRLVIDGGFFAAKVEVNNSPQTIASFSANAASAKFTNLEWILGNSSAPRRQLATSLNSTLSPTRPILELIDCRDGASPIFKAILVEDGTNLQSQQIDVRLSGGTRLGDIRANDLSTRFPASLSTTSEDEFGFGGLTRAQMVAAFAAAGVPQSIDAGTRIVDRNGTVLSELATVV